MTLAQKEEALKACDELEKIDLVETAKERKLSQIGNFSIENFDAKLKRGSNEIPVTERWIFLIINTVKAIPAIFLLVFVIKQYVRERNFQEEYAFKSAVSLTILAYSDQLKDGANKDKLIMDSVTNVYDSPIQKKIIKEEEKLNTDKIAEELKKALEKYLPDILKK